jgi:RNA recognition motif-containing protein
MVRRAPRTLVLPTRRKCACSRDNEGNLIRFCRLYIKNLPDKIQKPDIRMALYTLFATYGPVLDVVVMRTVKMRGQAHIVFRDIQASTQALRALQGFDFFGKELVSRPGLLVIKRKYRY